MINRDVLHSRLEYLREYIQDLAEYRGIALATYMTSKKDQRFVERTLHLACECCIDIASHIVSTEGFRSPKNNKDLFKILFENGVLSESVSQSMMKMAQFRNIVVHDYTRIDPEIVIGILHKDIDDLNNFSREVLDRFTLE